MVKFFLGLISERVRVYRTAPHLVPKVQSTPGLIINLNLSKMSNLTTGSIVFTKVITHTNKNDEQVQSSLSTVKLVDGTITKVFAYSEDISGKDVIFCSKIAHGQPLYEGSSRLSEPGQDLLYEGTSTVAGLKAVNETLAACKEFSL